MSVGTAARPRTRRVTPGSPRALVLRAPGTNCDRETALALALAGARPERVHVEALLAGEADLDRFALMVLPGGFSFGDHLGAGVLWADRLQALREGLRRFVASGRPVLGICNGFQALLKLGLLEGGALAANASGRFECRWVWLERPATAATPLLAGIDRIALPVAHGEGRFVAASAAALRELQVSGAVALTYASVGPNGTAAPGSDGTARQSRHAGIPPDVGTGANDGTMAAIGYPANPNGSAGAVAALANAAGNVLGLMPHPERCVLDGQAPSGRADGAGLAIFRNAVALARG